MLIPPLKNAVKMPSIHDFLSARGSARQQSEVQADPQADPVAAIFALVLYTRSHGIPLELKHQILVIPVSVLTWIIVTFVTKPEPIETLNEFYKRVKPWGWWKPVSDLNPDIEKPRFTPVLINWVLGVSFILFGMMGAGKSTVARLLAAMPAPNGPQVAVLWKIR